MAAQARPAHHTVVPSTIDRIQRAISQLRRGRGENSGSCKTRSLMPLPKCHCEGFAPTRYTSMLTAVLQPVNTWWGRVGRVRRWQVIRPANVRSTPEPRLAARLPQPFGAEPQDPTFVA